MPFSLRQARSGNANLARSISRNSNMNCHRSPQPPPRRGTGRAWHAASAIVLSVFSWAVSAQARQSSPPPWPSGDSSAVADLLERVGIRPLASPTAAVDLELEGLDGGAVRLSEAGGRFVVLTFFATWCRPCVAEMPTLQTLHDEDTAVEVWAVSVDAAPGPIAPFLEVLGVDFPVLWDRDGVAARTYRAGAIPVSYVLDPDGRILGVARGARDWSQLVGFFEQLGQGSPDNEPHGARAWRAPASEPEPIALPLRLTPPEAEVELLTDEARPGHPFSLEVAVRWAGDFEQYLLHPPRVTLPDGVEQAGVAATTSSREGASVVVYRIDLRADTSGEYALDPVELRYTPMYETEPVTHRLAGPTVVVRRPGWQRALPALGGATAATVGLAMVVMVLARRRKGSEGRVGVEEDREELSTAIAEVRRLRVEGSGADALSRLDDLAAQWLDGSEIGVDRRELTDWLERCRYGGEQPPEQLLDRTLRRLEKRMQELRNSRKDEPRGELGLLGEASPESNRNIEHTRR